MNKIWFLSKINKKLNKKDIKPIHLFVYDELINQGGDEFTILSGYEKEYTVNFAVRCYYVLKKCDVISLCRLVMENIDGIVIKTNVIDVRKTLAKEGKNPHFLTIADVVKLYQEKYS